MSRCLAPLLLVLPAACEEGPSAETLIEDVQVIAGVGDPPVVSAGESWTLTATVADPVQRGAEVLVWSCLDETCPTLRGSLEDERAVFDVVSVAPIPLWILACDPGICDMDDPAIDDLQDPLSWMARLPLEGVSLALRSVVISDTPEDPPAANPEILVSPASERLEGLTTGDRRALSFTVPGATTAWGYSTDGGFGRPSEDIASDGAVRLTWYAPNKPGDVRLYVVFEDDAGGTSVWLRDLSVAGKN